MEQPAASWFKKYVGQKFGIFRQNSDRNSCKFYDRKEYGSSANISNLPRLKFLKMGRGFSALHFWMKTIQQQEEDFYDNVQFSDSVRKFSNNFSTTRNLVGTFVPLLSPLATTPLKGDGLEEKRS